jgi:uncharacterized repeat protein (TIGR03803 family)
MKKRRVMNLFCAAVLAATLVSANSVWAADTVLYNFAGPPNDGANSYSTPINDQYGNLYGTTSAGGTNGDGTVFVLCAPYVVGNDIFPCTAGLGNWTEFVLYNFRGVGVADGATPYSTLVFNGLYRGRRFTLYGTTYNGGIAKTCRAKGNNSLGCGTVFELCAPLNAGGCSPGNYWKEAVLHRFVGGRDGSHPFAGLITDKGSDLFGTTLYGGGDGNCVVNGANQNCGTVFKLKGQNPWNFPYSVLHRFAGGAGDGANPYSALCCNTLNAIAYLYGTTYNAGSQNAGVVFKVQNVLGYPETILYNFCSVGGCLDGANPVADVIFDNAGNLYSTTSNGGSSNVGVAYKLTPADVESVLHNFLGGPADGTYPNAGLLFDPAGDLYGTTVHGGSGCGGSCGAVFELTTPNWNESILNNFVGTPDGSFPFAGVAFDPPFPGTLYGTTVNGGSYASSYGTVYSVP